jgi:hypothetical protein
MAINVKDIKQNIKDDLAINLIDLEGDVDSKGNYIYLSGFKKPEPLINEYEFTLLLASMTFSGSEESLEATLGQVIDKIPLMMFGDKYKEISLSSGKMIKKEEASLFIYECKLNVQMRWSRY